MIESTSSKKIRAFLNQDHLFATNDFQKQNHISIEAGHGLLPIEITVVGKFPVGSSKSFLDSAFKLQETHPEFIDEYNEPSALIGKTNFSQNDPTAVYTFGVDVRDLVFHRHNGHRIITGITGLEGCILKFSLCSPEEAEESPEIFLEKMYVVKIPGDRMFILRFNGNIYHQFCPIQRSEKAFFAISVHTDEAKGLEGELLEQVLNNKGSIPLLTEPAANAVMDLLKKPDAYQSAKIIELDVV